jgi:glutathione S-transferase
MAMKLYFNPQSRAVIAKWMLDECGAPYEIVPIDIQKREHKTPGFLRVNPAGKLPALVDGDATLFESAAICLYLAEKFPAARLAPAVGAPERARYLTLMVYSTSQLEPAMGDSLIGVETAAMRGWTDFETVRDVVEGALGDGPYLFGDWFTAADVMIGSMFIWKRLWGRPERPKIEAYVDRLLERPAAPRLQPPGAQ